MELREAFEQSLAAMGIDDLDGISDDIPAEPVDKTEDDAPEDEAVESEEVELPEDSEDAVEDAEEAVEEDSYIEIAEGAKLKLPDGTIVPADKAVLMQADYTRKTQELADQRKQFESEREQFTSREKEVQQVYEEMRGWYEERASNPSGWMLEIASQAQDATAVVAQSLQQMAQAGILDKEFVKIFGIESGQVSEIAKQAKVETEIDRLRKQIEERDEREAKSSAEQKRQELISQRAAAYEQEWQQIKSEHSLQFANGDEELASKRELLKFAMDNKLTKSLVDAYDLMSLRMRRESPQPAELPDVASKKRASRAVTPKTAVSGEAKRVKKSISDREAILEAMEGVGF